MPWCQTTIFFFKISLCFHVNKFYEKKKKIVNFVSHRVDFFSYMTHYVYKVEAVAYGRLKKKSK